MSSIPVHPECGASDGARVNMLLVAQAVLQRELALCRAHVAQGGVSAGRLVVQASETYLPSRNFPQRLLN